MVPAMRKKRSNSIVHSKPTYFQLSPEEFKNKIPDPRRPPMHKLKKRNWRFVRIRSADLKLPRMKAFHEALKPLSLKEVE